ncbi:MAG TPA: nuclear transport factor 2 family protein [Thermomicrobiales bacterium]|nr:nuclear transport factor 2 family protein [Thermomicrobiales bacterium]
MSVDDVRQVSDRFYSGMNRAINGDPGAMSELPDVCSQTDDMTLMSEMGGRQLGWPEVRATWEMGAQAVSGGSVAVSDLRVTLLGQDGAYTTGTLTASVLIGATPLHFSARCTDVFRREGGAWKLIHHHLDMLPDAAAFQTAMAQGN